MLLLVADVMLDVGKRMGGREGLRMLRGRQVANLLGTNEEAVDAVKSAIGHFGDPYSIATTAHTWSLGWQRSRVA